MKLIRSSPLAILATGISPALGHWTYSRLVVNNEVVGEPWQYIRPSNISNAPLQDVNSTDFRCNSGGASGSETETYTVRAGDELGFGIDETFGHPGIQQVYLSKAPDGSAAAEYDGGGDWARIYSLTWAPPSPQSNSSEPKVLEWATHGMHSFRFTLPASTPPGEYLLRSEGLALHAAHKWANAQFYVACAQLKVTNEGKSGEDLTPTVKIPGVYKGDEPGVLIPVFWSYATNYTTPGPALWPEGTVEQHSRIVLS